MTGKNFSRNNVSGKRRKNDFYQTPKNLTRRFLNEEPFDKSCSVLEPACGQNAITTVLEEYWDKKHISSYDIEKNFFSETDQCDYIITNPPFSKALDFIIKAKSVATKKFAFLLPLSYLHGKKRFDTIYSDKAYGLEKVYVFTRYPLLSDAIRDDGKYRTGMITYAWYVFTNNFSGDPKIFWLDNNDDVLKKGQ